MYSSFHCELLRILSEARIIGNVKFEHVLCCWSFSFSVTHLELVILQNDLPFFGS